MSTHFFDFLIDRNLFRSRQEIKPLPPLLQRHQKLKTPPLITISRLTGSGGRKIADLLASKLGKPWKVYDKEIMAEVAKTAKKREDFFKDFDEKSVSLVEEYINDFFGKQIPIFSGYEKILIKVLTAIGQKGYAVIVGRGANFLFPDSLRIRIVAPENVRLERMVKYEPKYTRHQSIRWMKKTDFNRDEFVKRIYDKDPADPVYYDLVINTENISLEATTMAIYHAARYAFFR